MTPPPSLAHDPLLRQLTAALDHHRRGDLVKARQLYRDILRQSPRCFDALHLLGVATTESGGLEEGIGLIRAALAVDSSQANAHNSLARALLTNGDRAAALACLERAAALQPNDADTWLLLGNVQQQTGRLDDAVTSYERAIMLRPGLPEAFNNLAAALRSLRRTQRALECADRALLLRPAYAMALNNRGLVLLDQHRAAAAVDAFHQALALDPNFAQALHNLGTALMQLRRFADARDAFARLAAIAPHFPHAQGNLLHARLTCCDWTDFVPTMQAVTQSMAQGAPADVPLSFLAVADSTELQLRCAQAYTNAFFPESSGPARRHRRHDRIRVAYLSGDFGEHAVTYLLAGVFERHDAARFDIIGLSWDRQNDGPLRRRVETAFSRFIDITAMADDEVARLIQELEVDILVDLCGHTGGHRTGILARRPGDIRVNYLGLPATMGATYIDYLIADRFLIPEDRRVHYSEHVVWLPETFQPNDDARGFAAHPGSRTAHGLPETGLVFCSFNSNFKLNPVCFDIWMRLLKAVPASILWLLASSADAERNLRREAAERGVDASRLVFATQVPYEAYLARYAHADLFLDSLPYNGGTTVSGALTMGVPVLTCAGSSFAARMAGSLLMNLGLAELVTHSLADYESAALALAKNPTRLSALRRLLQERRTHHSFFDTDRYRRHLESAYRTMWERHSTGLPPAAFSVPAIN
ncbi:MAG: tetratricopeptide repeat protein [Steroidobacteraceae bacterium]